MTQQLQYPRIPHDKKLSVKLTLADIELIRTLYINNKVTTISKLASMFDVDPATIKYWIDPLFRQIVIKKSIERLTYKWAHDPVWKAKQTRYRSDLQNERRKKDMPFRLWITQKNSIRQNKKRLLPFRQFMHLVENGA